MTTPPTIRNTSGGTASASAHLKHLLMALVLMLLIAVFYSQSKIDTENFALGEANTHITETSNGTPLTAASITGIRSLIAHPGPCKGNSSNRILWLGNSQLHTINQYRPNDHLAPYWLHHSLNQDACAWVNGISLPNANFQEYLTLLTYATLSNKPSIVVLSLVFDDLREDGLRDDFRILQSETMHEKLALSDAGIDILKKLTANSVNEENMTNNQGLEGFVQKHFEDALTAYLGIHLPIWNERPNLRAKLMTDLYFLRNFVLGIKSTSTRKQIPNRYKKNMAALEATFNLLKHAKIPTIAYIAPIRGDINIPYDAQEYNAWKNQINQLTEIYKIDLLNIEAIVPSEKWGTYHADEIDFMHFQGDGHKILSRAIEPAVRKALQEPK